MTQKALAAEVGLTQQALSRFEAGVAPKGLTSALAIAKALRVRVTAIWPDAEPKRRTR